MVISSATCKIESRVSSRRRREEINKPAYKAAAEHALLSLSESDRPLVTFTGDLKQLVTVTCNPDKSTVVADQLPGRYIGRLCSVERKRAFARVEIGEGEAKGES